MPNDPLTDPLLRSPRSFVPTIPAMTEAAAAATPEQLADFVDAIGAAGGGGGGGNATNLGVVAGPTGVTVTSDTGTDAALPLADGTNAGLMAPAQHTKLAALPTGAELAAAQQAQDLAIAGKASLIGGKLDPAQVPDIALQQYLGVVASQAAMLALAGQSGDWCTRSDTGTDWRIIGNPASLAGWLQTSYPSAPVSSVNGKTGAVTLAKADMGLGNVDNTADSAKPVSTAQAAAIAAKMDASMPALQAVFDGGTAAQKAAFQSSVSGASLRHVGATNNCTQVVSGVQQFNSRFTTRIYGDFRTKPITFVFPNWRAVSNVGESGTGGPLTINAAVWMSNGNVYNLTFSGSLTGVIPDQQNLSADPIIIPEMTNNSWYEIRVWGSSSSGVPYFTCPASTTHQYGHSYEVGATVTSKCYVGSGAITSNANGACYGPVAVLAVANNRTIFCAGDSRMEGGSDNFYRNGPHFGEVVRAVAQDYAHINAGCGGDTATACASSYSRRAELAAWCTESIVYIGINDIHTRALSASNTMAAIHNMLAKLPAWHRRRLCTLPPVSSSTDGWTTTTNQTVSSKNSTTTTVNQAIRFLRASTLQSGGYLEIADLVSTASDSGVWQAGYTIDGVHSNSTAIALVASALRPQI